MKMQLTAIAAAVALAVSFSASADPRDWTNDTTSYSPSAATFGAQEGIRSGMDGYSQHSDSTVQYSKIDQSGAGANALVNQYDGPQYSLIEQSGADDQATVEQRSGNLNGQNESIIKQHSYNDGNTATVKQIGYRNDSYIDQLGDNNTATVNQINNTQLSDSIIHQRGENNEATINQTNNTDETWSFVGQYGDNNIAVVSQNMADLSSSYIYQDSNSLSVGHYAEVTQTGQTNLSVIRQVGNTPGHAVHNQSGMPGNNTAISNQW
ncbi:hypothetical protein GPM19_13540 [Halomonas sp. ZH2S]|uniref:Curlin associated repeat-containing protein n=1 Tax=Vreelandella zhuhanensis TaxID=2684210 RepID=A0A7X3KRU5_9GAMM|nr:hypothetical protein [Halomonas zhuhanensis]MWJ29203.1 hypothetical protein [Halomonas zhuhanensis]